MIYENVLKNPDLFDFEISDLGPREISSPVSGRQFIEDDERIAFSSQVKNILKQIRTCKTFPSFEKAGPREKIFHRPQSTRAAVITCGGLCPGLNNVIKGLVTVLELEYEVRSILGIRYGYKGLTKDSSHQPLELNCSTVDAIHKQGGTILGSSRGNQDPKKMVDELVKLKVNLLFCVGGDGTLKGAKAIAEEIGKRNLGISVIGIPKTIDNDLSFVEKTFGFETSVHISGEIISSAHHEAEGAENGIGIVKLMGRDSGFIAATAALANSVVDFCLVPEVSFCLDGVKGLLEALAQRLKENSHAVIVVAEGAGQELFENSPKRKDQSGNVLKDDIGERLKSEIEQHFSANNKAVSIKYLDPSYHIRSVPAIASDAVFCYQLAEYAVHAGMAGKTNLLIGHWNNFFTHVPIALATEQRRMIDLDSALWKGVLSATQQDKVLG